MTTVLASGADERYGNWLLNLVGSVKANSDVFDRIVVYDLGLSPFQRRLVHGVRGLEVRTVPPFVPHWRQGRTWKTWIWTHLEAETLVWLDAGVTVLRPLDGILAQIGEHGYFVVSQGVPNRSCIPTDYAELYGLADEQLDRVQIAAGILGFRRHSTFYDDVVVPTYEDCAAGRSLGYSPAEAHQLNVGLDRAQEVVTRDCPQFRWDQTVLNVHFARTVDDAIVNDLDEYAGWRSPNDHPDQVLWSHRRRGDFAYLPRVPYRAGTLIVGKAWGAWSRWHWWARNHSWLFRPSNYLRKVKRVTTAPFTQVPPARLLRRLYVGSGVQQALPHRVKVVGRRGWLRIAKAVGYPISSPLVSRPPLARRRSPIQLTRVLLACDLNRDYLNFWPSTRKAWTEIVGIEPLLVLVAEPERIPLELRADNGVVVFPPVEGVHSVLQAQCIRLLYPALLDAPGAVLISDIDLFPLNPAYFHAPLASLDERYFVTYRDTRLNRGEVPMAYNAASPATWGEIFDVASVDDVRSRLAEWGARGDYDGRPGWEGWYRDQEILYESLTSWPAAPGRLWMLDDDYCGFNRLDRMELVHEEGLEPRRRRALRTMRYTDYTCLLPYGEHRELNDLVLELALDAARARPRRRRQFSQVA